MNEAKWIEKSDDKNTEGSEFLAKLIEEVGEVGLAFNEQTTDALIEELGHVIFIAECYRHNLSGANSDA